MEGMKIHDLHFGFSYEHIIIKDHNDKTVFDDDATALRYSKYNDCEMQSIYFGTYATTIYLV